MASPVVQAGHKTAGANATSVTINKPDNVVEGDLLVAVVGGSFQLAGTPSGWTSVLGVDPGQVTLRVVYKIATDSEPSTYTFTSVHLSTRFGAVIARITGHDPANPIDVTATHNTDQVGDSTLEYPQITTTVADTLILIAQSANAHHTQTNSFSEATEIGVGSNASEKATLAYRNQTTAGLITQEINTMSHSGRWTAWCMSIRPSAPPLTSLPSELFKPSTNTLLRL